MIRSIAILSGKLLPALVLGLILASTPALYAQPNPDVNNDGSVNQTDVDLWLAWRDLMVLGDVNADGVVNGDDVNIITPQLGQPADLTTNIDGDGLVTQADLDIVNANLGQFLDFIVGDADGNFIVDQADYTTWKQNFGTAPTANSGEDFNRDGAINTQDYPLWRDALDSRLNSNVDINQDGRVLLDDLQFILDELASPAVFPGPKVGAAPIETAAGPQLTVTSLGVNASGNREWLVEVTPDPTLFATAVGDVPHKGVGGSLAVELGLSVVEGTLLGVTPNPGVWESDNPGVSPFAFTGEGIVVNGNEIFVGLGSSFLTSGDAVPLVTIETEGSGLTTLDWLGAYGGAGRLAQAGGVFDTAVGTLTAIPEPTTMALFTGVIVLFMSTNARNQRQ